MKIKKFENFNKINEELYDGEMEIKRQLSELEDGEKYKLFMDEYNSIVDKYGIRLGSFHKWNALYDVDDDRNIEKTLMIDIDWNGNLKELKYYKNGD